MGIRMTQWCGLNERARKMIKAPMRKYKDRTVRIYDDGQTASFEHEGELPDREADVYDTDTLHSMFDEETPLMQYTMRDGRVYKEVIQCAPWSSGPCIFLCLADGDGNIIKESEWTDEEIDREV